MQNSRSLKEAFDSSIKGADVDLLALFHHFERWLSVDVIQLYLRYNLLNLFFCYLVVYCNVQETKENTK